MPYLNEKWSAEVLGMRVNHGRGIDLTAEDKQVEIKFTLENPGEPYVSWHVQEHELSFANHLPAFWGLGVYALDAPVKRIKTTDEKKLEECVKRRELYIIEWDWMNQFEKYHHIGRTKISEWDYWMRFAKLNAVPDITKTYPVKKGVVHLTKGVPNCLFNLALPCS